MELKAHSWSTSDRSFPNMSWCDVCDFADTETSVSAHSPPRPHSPQDEGQIIFDVDGRRDSQVRSPPSGLFPRQPQPLAPKVSTWACLRCVCVRPRPAVSFRGDDCHAQCAFHFFPHSSFFHFSPHLSPSGNTAFVYVYICIYFYFFLVSHLRMSLQTPRSLIPCMLFCVCVFSRKRTSWKKSGTWTSWWRMQTGLQTGLVGRKTFPPSKSQLSKHQRDVSMAAKHTQLLVVLTKCSVTMAIKFARGQPPKNADVTL